MVNFVLQGVSVGINQGIIYTDNPRVKRVLKHYLEDEELFGPGDGDPDWAYAKLFVSRFGGRITRGDPVKVDPALIY